MKNVCLVTLMAALLMAPPVMSAKPKPTEAVVNIASGRIRGARSGGLLVFKGIPYAQAPVGDLRWRPPQPVKPWEDVKAALNFGHDCMQLPFPGDAAPLRTQPSEDCLYINIWTPRKHGEKPLPVLVWIYGGGFVNGGTSPAVYSGEQFARRGLVFVSFNYRLGRFGFFAFPALDQGDGPVGNYAFMDQIAALHWVQENIAAFGGDPHQVTIFGESAGGASVNVLLTSPMSRGLFQRAIVESGGGRDTILRPKALDHPGERGQTSAEQDGIAFAKHMGIEGTDEAAVAALRQLPAEKIVNDLNMASMFRQRDIYSGPMVDGKVIVQSAEQAFKEGKQAEVAVITGANSADIGFTSAQTAEELFAPFGAKAGAARAAFDPQHDGKFKAVAQQVGQVEDMIEPARFVARRVAAGGQAAYEYRFSYVATRLRKKFGGAPHSSEIPYVFDTIRESMWSDFGKGIKRQDLRTARQMNVYWVNFAKTGDPNGPGLPQWPKISAEGDQLLNFTAKGPKAETDPWRAQLDLVESMQP